MAGIESIQMGEKFNRKRPSKTTKDNEK